MSAGPSALSASASAPSTTPEFGRTALAILAAMVLLIVALAGILVETTWSSPTSSVEVLPSDPGSFARR
jgi:hypothetical protein